MVFGETVNRFSRKYLVAVVLACNLSSLALGITLTWSAPVLPKINNSTNLDGNPFGKPVSSEEGSWIVSLTSLGAGFGPFLAGFLSERIGRKYSLLCSVGIPFLISFIILAFAQTTILYCIARFVAGFGIGGLFSVLPVYFSEISEVSIRGMVCSTFTTFIVLGDLYSYVVGPYTSIMIFSIVCAIVPASFLITFVFCAESPYYFIAKGNVPAAEDSLMKLRNRDRKEIAEELKMIQESVELDMKNKRTLRDIFKDKGLKKALLISIGLYTFQQTSGVNVVLAYTTSIFQSSGSTLNSDISSIVVGLVQLIGSFPSPLLVDRLGRKILLLLSAAVMMLAQLSLGIYFFIKDHNDGINSLGWLPITSLVIFNIGFNMGFGPLPSTVMGEVFPADVKSAASTVSVSYCWFLSFLVSKFFPNLSNCIGMGGSFCFFSGWCFASILFIIFCVIETKARTFQEIQEMLNK